MNRLSKTVLAVSDDEEGVIQKQIAADSDDGDATDEEIMSAKPFAEALPELMESIRRARGRPFAQQTKVPVTIRLDPDIVEHYKAGGKGWQSRMNDDLRKLAGL